jgi:transglutaminase-like putative cysteine protease
MSTAPTAILDHEAPAIRGLIARASVTSESPEGLATLEAAYAIIRDEVRAVYALEETTPASRTLARGFGSCSQRLAILESAARGLGIPTRARALLVDRSFWYPRFPRTRFALPDQILLVWPEFAVEGEWQSASELFGPIGCRGGGTFRNEGAETLFEAIGRCAVDWDGHGDAGDPYDLSRFVRADLGCFADRDTVFARFGQTLCAPSRALADPFLRRIAA